MRHPIRHSSLAVVALLVGACSSAGNGAGAGGRESASATPAASAMPAPHFPQPESLPKSEPSRQRDMPIVGAPEDTGGARATIARLEREARAIAKSTGCNSVAACRTAPVGAKACGGPRDYITYCAATTDTAKLMRTLRELERVEKAYNATSGMMSTCEMRLPPTTELVGTTCREAAASGQNRVP